MKVRLDASGFDLGSELEKYAASKVARATKKLPRELRGSATCVLYLKQTKKKRMRLNTCCFNLLVDGTELKVEETTQHMYAALDIAAVHMEHQLADYLTRRPKHAIRAKLKRSIEADWPSV